MNTDKTQKETPTASTHETVSRLTIGGKEIVILGTAHISRESVDQVGSLIREENPDHVCVEIDAARYQSLENGQNWANLKIDQVLKQRKGFLLLANLALSSFQRKLGKELGTTPGEEMKAAVSTAQELNIPFSFSDREVQTTLRRAWSRSSLWNKNKMLAALLSSVFTSEKLTAEEIEQLKKRSAIQDMMEELAAYLPSVKEVLIDERDQYLASNIFRAEGKKIVAVIGAGHMNGIIAWLEKFESGEGDTDLSQLEELPIPSKAGKIVPWIIPALVAGLMVYGFVNSGFMRGIEMFFYWFMVNGVLSAIGAVIAMAHPVTIIVSFLAAPFTSLNPTIGVGIVAGLIEVWVRRPRVADFEHLPEDILSVRGFYRNRVTHALVVFFLSSVGSAIGTFVAFPFLLRLLS